MKNTLPEVDRYIEKAAPFAQPILKRIRRAYHRAHPEVTEVIKWGVPFFEYKGVLGNMAAFKNHVGWGFWKGTLMKDPQGVIPAERLAMGGAKVTDISQLPSEDVLVEYVRQAIRLNEEGVKPERKPAKAKPVIDVPPEFLAALKKQAGAKKAFDAMPPSHRREYLEWITDAKQEATRAKRMATAVEWISEGKSRNWKYARKK